MTFRCPIDGRELADGKPCPEHGIAFSKSDGQTHVVASARPLSRSTKAAAKPSRKRSSK